MTEDERQLYKDQDAQSAWDSLYTTTMDFNDIRGSWCPAMKKPRCRHCGYSKYLHSNGGRFDDGQNKYTIKTCKNFEEEK